MASPQYEPPTLLSIPQELRDMIIEYVISAILPRPDLHDEDYAGYALPPKPLPCNPAAGLLVTNKSVRLQALAINSRLQIPPTLVVEPGRFSPYWGPVPSYVDLRAWPFDPQRKVFERVDLVPSSDFFLEASDHIRSIEKATLELCERVLERCMIGLDFCKPDCAVSRREAFSNADGSRHICFAACQIRELRVYLHNVPDVSAEIDKGLTYLTEYVDPESYRGQFRKIKSLVEHVSFWCGGSVVRQYDLSETLVECFR